MSRQIEERLRVLDSEYETGQKMLVELETRRSNLSQTLLRIDGARQVLRELIASTPAESQSPEATGAGARASAHS